MVKKFWSFGVLFIYQALRLFLQLSGKLGNLGSQWKCWPNLRQAVLCGSYPSAISGSLWALRSKSPHSFIGRTVYIPIESVASFSSCLHLALTACRALDLSYIHSPMQEWDIKKKKKSLPCTIQLEMILVLYPAESSRKY